MAQMVISINSSGSIPYPLMMKSNPHQSTYNYYTNYTVYVRQTLGEERVLQYLLTKSPGIWFTGLYYLYCKSKSRWSLPTCISYHSCQEIQTSGVTDCAITYLVFKEEIPLGKMGGTLKT